jgi:hypothetical protein
MRRVGAIFGPFLPWIFAEASSSGGLPLTHWLQTHFLCKGLQQSVKNEKARQRRAIPLISLEKIGCGDRI